MKTDSELTTDVQAELDWDSSVDNRGIVVAAKDGVVTLAGYVSSYVDKWAAEKAAKNVAGVRAIADDIEVKIGATAQRSDREIAEAAVNALKSNVSVPAADIKTIVNEGWVTLEGNVALWYQKSAAENAVRNLWGSRASSITSSSRQRSTRAISKEGFTRASSGTPIWMRTRSRSPWPTAL
jgi:osmotically-inducible protein OsmY